MTARQGKESTGKDAHHDNASTTTDAGQIQPVDAPLPRPTRRRRRAKADQGLPPDADLERLAMAYLERQRKHWPALVEAGLLPEATQAIIREMVEDFKHRHRTGQVDIDNVLPFANAVRKLSGSYNRFSCDNSDATSNLDQMVNGLDRSHDEDRFIPWSYVFCDYSVTGLDPARQGYSSYKAVLTDENHLVETTYIDDFTRASRDEIEWWRLAALSKKLNKRMIGASDGFDLSNPNSDVLITVFGLVSRLFIKSLREKVKRGMKGGAERGNCLGKLSLGFTRRVKRDAKGNVVCRSDGQPRKEPCIDPDTKAHRVLLYELFTQKRWSAYKIMRHFNKLKVDGWDGWSEKAIKQLLWNPNAIGVFIWNRTRREYDWEEGKWVKLKNPRSEWAIHYDRDLAIVPLEMWRAARRKLAAMRRNSPRTGRKLSRNQVSASTLFSGTLFCDYCTDNECNDAEIKLIRSTEKYKQMGCLSGIRGAHGCQLSSSKSTKIIEESLLAYIRDAVLTEAAVDDLVVRVNGFLKEEAKKPLIDTRPKKANARKLRAKIDKLVQRVEDEPDKDLCAAYDKRIKELQKDLKPLEDQIREADQRNRKRKIKPLDPKRAKKYLKDLRGLLDQETPMAAEAIRTLTGPIRIRQEKVPGRNHGARWIAKFSPDLVRLLRVLARDKDYPDSVALCSAVMPTPETVELKIEKVHKYEQLAPKVREMRAKGASVQTIASAFGLCWKYANDVVQFAESGERPKWKAGKPTGKGGKENKCLKFQKKVAHLRDKKKMPFPRIAETLGISEGTVRRAYDGEHKDEIREAAMRGETPSRGRCTLLGEDVYQRIRKFLRKGMSVSAIAAKVGCGTSTVYRERRKL